MGALPMLVSLLVDLFPIGDEFQSAMAMFSKLWCITNCSEQESVWTVWTTYMQCNYLSPMSKCLRSGLFRVLEFTLIYLLNSQLIIQIDYLLLVSVDQSNDFVIDFEIPKPLCNNG